MPDFDAKTVIGGSIFLIFIYLVITNGDKTAAVIKALGGVATAQTKALQGNG